VSTREVFQRWLAYCSNVNVIDDYILYLCTTALCVYSCLLVLECSSVHTSIHPVCIMYACLVCGYIKLFVPMCVCRLCLNFVIPICVSKSVHFLSVHFRSVHFRSVHFRSVHFRSVHYRPRFRLVGIAVFSGDPTPAVRLMLHPSRPPPQPHLWRSEHAAVTWTTTTNRLS
jgi:hypothetical protein